VSDTSPEVSIIVESYNHGEGSSLDRLELSLRAALRAADRYGPAEVLLADSSGDGEVAALLEREAPQVRRVDVSGHHYDEAKMVTALQARGEFILFHDGDVIPDRDDWAERHVSALRRGAAATCGMTRYEPGFLPSLYTVMDFGVLFPVKERDLRCYTSNNAGFRAETLAACPIPPGPMRCNCYLHSELLRRNGMAARMVPDAPVTHENQPFWEERLRRGYDQIRACWVNPQLPEARLVRLGPLAAPLFYARDVLLDWRRLLSGRRSLGMSRAKAALGLLVFPVLRLADLVGIVGALISPRSWWPRGPAKQPDPSP
jgi:glycosyltransferase involved in cell wall biosynthesis